MAFYCSDSHVRAVVATLGGSHGAAGRTDKWRYLYSGFTVWLSQTEAIGKFVFAFYPFIYLRHSTVISMVLADKLFQTIVGLIDLHMDMLGEGILYFMQIF